MLLHIQTRKIKVITKICFGKENLRIQFAFEFQTFVT